MSDHFCNWDDEPILDETLDSAKLWMNEFAESRNLDLESHYSAWDLIWEDAVGNTRAVQVSAFNRPAIGLHIYPKSWFDEEYGPGAERRHARIPRSFELRSPFSKKLFEDTLQIAVGDASAYDPRNAPDFCSGLTWSPGVAVYRKRRPVH
jgi:hypothetical protein